MASGGDLNVATSNGGPRDGPQHDEELLAIARTHSRHP